MCRWILLALLAMLLWSLRPKRQAAGYLAATSRPAYLADPDLKALIKELKDVDGTTKQPVTTGTSRMLGIAMHQVIPELWGNKPLIAARDQVNLTNEAVGALRVGESCNGGGEGYGLDANNTFIVTDAETGEITVEIYLKDSKTHLPRWVDMANLTIKSKVDVEAVYRNLYKVNGLTVCPPRREGRFWVEQPDSWSVRLSLLTLEAEHEEALRGILLAYEPFDKQIKIKLNTMLNYFRQRRKPDQKAGEEHRYILLTEGQNSFPGHRWMMEALETAGLGRINESIHLVPAALLRATCGAGRLLTPMPFLSTSTYDNMHKTFAESFLRANPVGDPDPELDVQGHSGPILGQHSWRRYADRTARDHKSYHQLPDSAIDMYCGWNLKEMDKSMQAHYAGQERAHRVLRRKLTQQG